MKIKRWSIVTMFVAVLVSAIVACVPSGPVSADAANDLMTKVLYRGLSLCYSNTYTNKTIPENGFSGANSLITDKGKKDGIIKVPNSVANSLNDGDISCAELFNGYSGIGGKMQGLIARTGKQVNKNTITSMGYHEQSAAGGEERGCVSFEYTYNKKNGNGVYEETNPVSTNEICFEIDPNDGSIVDVIDNYSSFTSPLYIYNNGDSILISGSVISDPTIYSTLWAYNVTWDKFKSTFEERVQGINGYPECDMLYDLECNNSRVYRISKVRAEKTAGGAKEYEKDSMDAATKALRYFTGNNSAKFDDYKYTITDTYNLASEYVKQNTSSLVIGSSNKCTTDLAKAKEETGYALRDGDKWCPVSGVQNVGGTFNIIEQEQGVLFSTNFAGVVNQLMGLNYTKLANEGTTPGAIGSGGLPSDGNNDGTVDAGDASTIAPCYDGSGALGWIICPVLQAVGEATEWLYDHAVEPLLQIRADTLFSGTDGIYVGWSTFRNFSNILFAIAFAVIILAQVTGIGISNYNIKKILPRFIMVVVLVNISYILCQLAVDISNILGFSIRELFEQLPVPGVEATGGQMVAVILNGLGLAAGVGLGVNAALSSVVVVSTLKYFMVPLVLAFLGCLLSVLFFFITMSVRQAGVVILVVLSPVAIVCYALPNTKSIFDKWRKIFTALLMVYPVCGLLMGGGNYVASLLLGAMQGAEEGMGTLYTITAMLVSIIPFFLIPSLVKGSMAMMGNLGMKIANFGNGISRGLNKGVMGTRAVQEHQAEQKRRLSIAQDQTKRDRIQRRVAEGSFRNRARALIGRPPRTELTNREATRLARAQAGINRATSETSAALEQTWANDGTANDFDAMQNILLNSAEAYAKDENNFEALERMNAAMRTLSGTEPGQDVIYSTFNQMEANAAEKLDEKGRMKTQRALRKMSNDLMAMSGDKIKKDAPILMKKMKNYQKMDIDGNIDTSRFYDNRSATGGLASLGEVAGSTADLSPATMPGVNESTLQTYIDAISSGRFARNSAEYNNVTTAARRALTDPHIKGQVKGKVATLLQQLANMDYTGEASGTVAATNSVARASEPELSRIQSGLRDMRERPDATSEPHRQQMLNTLERTMLRGAVATEGDEFNLSPSSATQIDKILKENGVNVAERFQAGEYDVDGSPVRNMSPDQFNQRYESMMGLKIDHSGDKAASDAEPAPSPQSRIITTNEVSAEEISRLKAAADQQMGRKRSANFSVDRGVAGRDGAQGQENSQNNSGNSDKKPPIIYT